MNSAHFNSNQVTGPDLGELPEDHIFLRVLFGQRKAEKNVKSAGFYRRGIPGGFPARAIPIDDIDEILPIYHPISSTLITPTAIRENLADPLHLTLDQQKHCIATCDRSDIMTWIEKAKTVPYFSAIRSFVLLRWAALLSEPDLPIYERAPRVVLEALLPKIIELSPAGLTIALNQAVSHKEPNLGLIAALSGTVADETLLALTDNLPNAEWLRLIRCYHHDAKTYQLLLSSADRRGEHKVGQVAAAMHARIDGFIATASDAEIEEAKTYIIDTYLPWRLENPGVKHTVFGDIDLVAASALWRGIGASSDIPPDWSDTLLGFIREGYDPEQVIVCKSIKRLCRLLIGTSHKDEVSFLSRAPQSFLSGMSTLQNLFSNEKGKIQRQQLLEFVNRYQNIGLYEALGSVTGDRAKTIIRIMEPYGLESLYEYKDVADTFRAMSDLMGNAYTYDLMMRKLKVEGARPGAFCQASWHDYCVGAVYRHLEHNGKGKRSMSQDPLPQAALFPKKQVIDGFHVYFPRSPLDIYNLGRSFRHCVGGAHYRRRAIEGDWIFAVKPTGVILEDYNLKDDKQFKKGVVVHSRGIEIYDARGFCNRGATDWERAAINSIIRNLALQARAPKTLDSPSSAGEGL